MHWTAVLLAAYAAGILEFWRLCEDAPTAPYAWGAPVRGALRVGRGEGVLAQGAEFENDGLVGREQIGIPSHLVIFHWFSTLPYAEVCTADRTHLRPLCTRDILTM
ncbi:hypothetical protein [Methylobacterium sp. J-076]|uniref:hypothetical protein n=1 Tax=Methylobacterium sp. J-076 TaxID=2836655 RepID=UPI001FBB4417|nr:hypothetical protein [Methylobacterium sp. J-076]MCJ2012739.1 hypothetical protein [Methylobacterium sp. J-076]